MRRKTESGKVVSSHSSACGASSLTTKVRIDSRSCVVLVVEDEVLAREREVGLEDVRPRPRRRRRGRRACSRWRAPGVGGLRHASRARRPSKQWHFLLSATASARWSPRTAPAGVELVTRAQACDPDRATLLPGSGRWSCRRRRGGRCATAAGGDGSGSASTCAPCAARGPRARCGSPAARRTRRAGVPEAVDAHQVARVPVRAAVQERRVPQRRHPVGHALNVDGSHHLLAQTGGGGGGQNGEHCHGDERRPAACGCVTRCSPRRVELSVPTR